MRLPPWGIYTVGGLVLVGGFLYFKRAGDAGTNANAPTEISSAPVTANVSGITDENGQLLPQFEWPYNQLALPFNYTSGNAQTIAYNDVLSPGYVTQQNPVQYAA